ncbi:MAG TPA: hypothetical protein EYN66_02780, partial [Myxococcales bacterium]|nr:hypothetical protein [Myxococcales bacterium]
MAIIVGRRDASPLISSAAPISVPDKSPTEEFAQGIKAAAVGFQLGKDVVGTASDLVTLGTKALQDTPEEKRAAFDKQQAELAENRFQKLKAERDSRFERSARNRDMLQTMGGMVRDKPDDAYKSGDDLLAAGDYEGAAAAYEKIAGQFAGPGDKRGEEALRRAENARNEPVFTVATKLDKDGQYDAAISELQNIAASNPELKDDANFRIELLEEQKRSALTRRKTAMEAETWEEAQRLMKTKDYQDLSPEDAMRKAAMDMAAEEMGPRPVLWKEVQTKALIAASQTDPKVRQRMLAEVLTNFDKSGGLGVPVENWYDMWTGDHIVKARANIVNLFKMTPEQAAKVEKTLAEAADKREFTRLRAPESASLVTSRQASAFKDATLSSLAPGEARSRRIVANASSRRASAMSRRATQDVKESKQRMKHKAVKYFTLT